MDTKNKSASGGRGAKGRDIVESRADSRATGTARLDICRHEAYELLLDDVPGKKYQRIIALCCHCDAVATRLWLSPLGERLGWLWPDREKAHRAWKRRLRAHGIDV